MNSGLTAYACSVYLKDLTWGGAVVVARADTADQARAAVERLFNDLPHADGNPFIVSDVTPIKDPLP